MPSFCTHEENRRKVCAPCGRKIKFVNKRLSFQINDHQENLIKEKLCPQFDKSNSKYPRSICATCRTILCEHANGETKRQLPKMPNYGDLTLPEETTNISKNCNCYICLTGRNNRHESVMKGKGNKRKFIGQIDIGLSSAFVIEKFKQISLKPKTSSYNKVCGKCFQIIGKGKNHRCRSYSTTAQNLIKNIGNKLPEKQQEKIASTLIKNKLQADNVKINNSKNIPLSLSTGGKNLRIIVKPDIKKIYFDEEKIYNYQVHTTSSLNQMKKFLNFLRTSSGKNSVPKNMYQKMSDRGKILKNLYKNDNYDFEVEKSECKEKRPVVWADAEELVEAVISERKITGRHVIKVMADGGQGFFKICFTILPESYLAENEYTFPIDLEYDGVPEKKRKLYSEGGSISCEAKLTSVKKVILLCIVPQIKESYDNVKLLFDLVQINRISFKFASDFKLLLIVNGQQTATSTCPCPYCFITLQELKDCQSLKDTESVDDESRKLKTYGDLKNDFNKYCSLGKDKKKAKDCHSTINQPLFDENDDVYVLEKCVIPELHILQGFVNHLFWDGLVPLLGKDQALIWPKKCNLVSKNYHGEIFEGNACRKLLKKTDALNDPEIYKDVGLLKILPFISAFKAMNKLVHISFSTKLEGSAAELHQVIREVRQTFLSTQVTETLKIHVATAHIENCLDFLSGAGLGLWSEQTGEAIHTEFLKYWALYRINLISDPRYGKQLLKAGIDFSSRHI